MFSNPEENVAQFGLSKGEYVADFGSGIGYYSFAAAEAVGENGRVYAIDVQKDLLQKLKNEAFNVRHLVNIEIVWGDLDNVGGTKLRDSSVDAVIAANVFFQLENKNNTCLEIKRILKTNGRLFLIDWSGSYGGVGPQQDYVFGITKARELFTKNGFVEEREINVGDKHYCLSFRKK